MATHSKSDITDLPGTPYRLSTVCKKALSSRLSTWHVGITNENCQYLTDHTVVIALLIVSLLLIELLSTAWLSYSDFALRALSNFSSFSFSSLNRSCTGSLFSLFASSAETRNIVCVGVGRLEQNLTNTLV